jgi:hypothetical protein
MDTNVLGTAQLVVQNKGKGTGGGELMKRSTGQLSLGDQAFERLRRNNASRNFGGIESQDGDVAVNIGSRNAENAIASGSVAVSVRRLEANTARIGCGEGAIGE